MDRTLVLEAVKKIGEKVLLAGWVETRRDHGKLVFIDLLDRSGVIQVVGGEELSSLRPQDVVEITGKVQKRPEKMVNSKIPTGGVEILSEKISILSKAEEMPFDMGGESLNLELPTLLDYRSLTLRHPKVKKIFKVQEAVMEGFRKAVQNLGCTEIFVPTISASATEGGTEVFKVDYYGNSAFMTQSPQLYKQMLVPVFERVFTIAHAYRAEPSVTTRHLSESTQLDCEFGFVDFETLLDYLELVGKETLKYVEDTCGEIFKDFGVEELKIAGKTPRLTMREAQKIILGRTGVDHTKEKDLMPEDEREICKWAQEEHHLDLVIITHYPIKKRAFYTKADPRDPEYSLSYDLLFRGVEILSGSQRVSDYEELVEVIRERGMDPDNFEMYLQAFRYGMPPEGGFSFGLERMTMQILKLSNIREASLFPRDMERVDIRLSKQSEFGNESENDVYEKILKLLDENKVIYQKYEHEPVFTSKDAAQIRGINIHQGAKALVMQADKDFILFVLPGDLEADLEKLQSKLGVKKLAMASKDSVIAKTGLVVGCIPPLGSVIGLKTYVDSRLSDNEEIAFNVGRYDRSVKMKYSDFIKIEKPEIVEI